MAVLTDILRARGATYKDIEWLAEQLDGRHGWKLVPVDLTNEMDFSVADHNPANTKEHLTLNEMWAAILAASPDPMAE